MSCISQSRTCYTAVNTHTHTPHHPNSQWLIAINVYFLFTAHVFHSWLQALLLAFFTPEPKLMGTPSSLSGTLSIWWQKMTRQMRSLTSKTLHKSDQHHFFGQSKSHAIPEIDSVGLYLPAEEHSWERKWKVWGMR